MKNSLNRYIPKGYLLYDKPDSFINLDNPPLIKEVLTKQKDKLRKSISDIFDEVKITEGMTLSFHHHLRNGDYVLNMVMDEVKKRNIKNLTIAPSSIFPCHKPLIDLIKNGNIVKIYTNYLNGPVADVISQGHLKEYLIMDTHGGRARAIETGDLPIDLAFIATPTADVSGNGNGIDGPSACGTLGYIIPDMKYAKTTVVVTDNLVDKVREPEILEKYIDYVVQVDSIGDRKGIVSGTTKPTQDPIQLKIAQNTAQLIKDLGLLKEGFSFQTGAGGTSLAVANHLDLMMQELKVKGSFASGGITSFIVNMYGKGLFEKMYDVQCFDLDAISSYAKNKNHIGISASKYASPYGNPIVNDLDVVILGATEVDKNFNCNVTTDSNNNIIGGSGGHSDTAFGAKVSIITTNLIKSRLPILKNEINTITTPGGTIDIIVTERGIAINPLRKDLIKQLSNSKLNFKSIDELILLAEKIAGVPEPLTKSDKVVGLVRYRNGSYIDSIYKKE